MGREMSCEQVTELAPELALGVADGHERESALRHLGACQTCRRLVSELSSVTDELLLLAPEHDAPPGLESGVLRAIEVSDKRRASRRRRRPIGGRWAAMRRPWRVGLAAASFVLAIAIGAGAMFATTAGDRRVAGEYRALLGVGQGSFFAASPLRSGVREVGTAWGYQGDPSWVFVSLRSPVGGSGWYRAWLVTSDGGRIALGRAELGMGHAAWGRNLPVDLAAARELRLEPEGGGRELVATFLPDDPWGDG